MKYAFPILWVVLCVALGTYSLIDFKDLKGHFSYEQRAIGNTNLLRVIDYELNVACYTRYTLKIFPVAVSCIPMSQLHEADLPRVEKLVE